jgi:hypothetical protein
MRYDAFISYSHAADGKLAPRLQLALHKLAKPWFKLRALSIFRDETDLSVSPGTWDAIQRALAESKHFVLMASPAAARSKWVRREVAFWLQERSLDTLLIVLTDGELVWSDEHGRIDGDRTDTLPPALVSAYQMEPLYADLRAAHSDVDLSLQNPDFKRRVLPIAARLHGKSPADLAGDEVREHRRTQRIRNAAISGLIALSLLAATGAYVAIRQAQEAERQRRSAVEAKEATERELLRAQIGELRALVQHIDVMLARPESAADAAQRERLRAERDEVNARLSEAAQAHQRTLAAAIGFRGDFAFLERWEGHAGQLKPPFGGGGVFIDPATDLALAKPDVIRARYAFILTPDELQAVLSFVGLRADAAATAWKATPIAERIRFAPADVARLVPEVAAPFWQGLVRRFPNLTGPSTPPAVQTVLLSLAFNIGIGNKAWDRLSQPIAAADWSAVADEIDRLAQQPKFARFPGVAKRRHAEAELLRSALAAAQPRLPAE